MSPLPRPPWLNLTAVAELTGLAKASVNNVAYRFLSAANPDTGMVSHEDFVAVVDDLIGKKVTDLQYQRSRTVLRHLLVVFDPANTGYVNAVHVASALGTLTSSTRVEKARHAFQMFDANRDGYVDRKEMHDFLKSVFKVHKCTHMHVRASTKH